METGYLNQKPMLPSRREIAKRLFRRRYVLLVAFLLVMAGFAITGQFTKKYNAKMEILVRKERVDSVLTPVAASTPNMESLSVSEEELNSEAQLLQGDDLLRQVVVQAGLAPAGDAIAVARAQRVLARSLNVQAIPKTDVISVGYTARNPDTAQRVLTTLGAQFLEQQRKLHGSDYELAFLTRQVQQHRSALDAAEVQLLAFTRKTGVVSASLERDLTVQQMHGMDEAELEARAAVADAAGRTATLRREVGSTAPRVETVAQTSDNAQLLEQIKSTLLQLQLKRSELLAEYDPHYRLIGDMDAKIAVTQTMLAAQVKAPLAEQSSDLNPVLPRLQGDLASADAELAGLRDKDVDLSRSSALLKKQAIDLQAEDVQQEQLLDAVKIEQGQYQLYMDKREEAKMSASLDRQGILNVVIAQPPSVPALPEHSRAFLLAVALLSACVLGLGAALLADMLDPTIREAAELEEMLGIPLVEAFGRHTFVERGRP